MKNKINVLSLFDGMSCGQIALNRLNIEVKNYFASEIDKHAIKVTQNNFPNTIQIGDVTNWKKWDIKWNEVDLILAGSPCQGFSFAGKQLAFNDSRSALFFTFIDILNHCKKYNPNVKYLLENVRMKKEHENVITDFLKTYPVLIDSAIITAQQRKRLYWSNIKTQKMLDGYNKTCVNDLKDKGLKIIDILENKQEGQNAVEISKQKRYGQHILESAFTGKSNSLTTFSHNSMVGVFPINKSFYLNDNQVKKASKYKEAKTFKTGNSRGGMPFPNNLNWKSLCLTTSNGSSRVVNFIDDGFGVRRLTPKEWERLQTVPEGYTDCVSNSQRYRMLGNGWTIDVICHIFNDLKTEL